METVAHAEVLARCGHALSAATRARLLPALREALDDLLSLILAVDPAVCPDSADEDCC